MNRQTVFEKEDNNYRLRIFYDDTPQSPREWDNLGTMVCWHRRYDLGDEHEYKTPSDFFRAIAEEIGYDTAEVYEMANEEVQDKVFNSDELVILPLYLYDHSGITMNTSGFSCSWDSGQVGWIYCTKDRFREETGYSEDELFNKDSHRKPKVKEHVKIKGRNLKPHEWGQVTEIKNDCVTVDFDYNKAAPFRKPENTVTVPLSDITEVMANYAEQMLVYEVETYDDYLTGNVYGYRLEKKGICESCGHVEYKELDSCWGFYGDSYKEWIANEIGSEFEYLLQY